MPLPRLVSWMVRAIAPRERLVTLLADLEEDYAARRARRGASWWLARETASLFAAYARARVAALSRVLPLLWRDCQIARRGLRHGLLPLGAAFALLAVGIAAVLITIGLLEALLLRPVSAVHGKALRRIVASDRDRPASTRFSFRELEVIRRHMADAGDVTAVYLQPVLLRVNSRSVQTMAEVVDGHYFSLLGTRPIAGRALLSPDDRLGAAPVAVLSAPFWRRHLNASPAAVGSTVQLNGVAYTVVGIADVSGSSSFLGASVDAWVTLSHADPLLNAGWRTNMRDRWFTVFVLPRSDIPIVESRLAASAATLARLDGETWRDRRLQSAEAIMMIGSQRTAAATLATVLGGLALLILVAAGANVGGVFVARAAANRRTAAIHMSIGAGLATIVRRQVIEGGLAGAVAGVLAIALYAWTRTALAEVALLPTLSVRLSLSLTSMQLAGAVAGSTLLGMLLSWGPARWNTRVDVAQALRDGDGRGGGSARATTLRQMLVSAQVALSLTLLVGAGLFVRSLSELSGAELGFAREQLVALDFDVEPAVRNRGELPVIARQALERVERLPNVIAAAMSNRAPVDQSTPSIDVQAGSDAASHVGDVTVYLATERYFETVGVPVLRGRGFTSSEVANAADVVIVNESLARALWGEADAVDRTLYLPAESRTLRIVGVARDSKYRTLAESRRPHIYRPAAPNLGLTLLARTRNGPRGVLPAIQRELDEVGPGLIGFFPRTFEDHLAVQLLPTRAAANAATLLGTLALCLSGTALYALVAWFVVLRRHEIGVRMALGASAAGVRRLIVRQAVRAAAPGVVIGLALASVLGVAARSALYEVSPADPVALSVAVAALVLVVLIAGYLPGRAATTMDPASILRQ